MHFKIILFFLKSAYQYEKWKNRDFRSSESRILFQEDLTLELGKPHCVYVTEKPCVPRVVFAHGKRSPCILMSSEQNIDQWMVASDQEFNK